jgi:hypothetical protein
MSLRDSLASAGAMVKNNFFCWNLYDFAVVPPDDRVSGILMLLYCFADGLLYRRRLLGVAEKVGQCLIL